MGFWSLLQCALFLLLVTALVKPVGGYLLRVFNAEKTLLDPALRPIEGLIYRVARINPTEEMDWKRYATCFVLLGLAGSLLLYGLLRVQRFLPWFYFSYHTTPLPPDLAVNTAISFSTTTTWQAYAGENTLSYFTQMVGLASQGFIAGGSGLAVGVAFIRGLSRDDSRTIGNFWVDVVRSILWILLPASIVGSLLLVWQGTPMNFQSYVEALPLEGGRQVIPQGPVAGLELIKNLGTNGGGFFNANGAHPYANPTPLTNYLGMLAIVVLPASLTNMYGRIIGRPRDGWLLYWVMTFLFFLGVLTTLWAEQSGNLPLARSYTPISEVSSKQWSGNMEGKEVRFGIGQSILTAVTTANTSTGSTNSTDDSYSPMGGMVILASMLLGEIVFGGLGSGLYGIIMIALIALFLAGIMIGRSPEYLGKVIGTSEIRLITLYTLAGPVILTTLTALALVTPAGLSSLTINSGPHGLTETLSAYASCFANNGQSFASLASNTVFYNVTTPVAMVVGRYGLAITALALAGRLAVQGRRPRTVGSLPTDTLSFAVLIVGTAFIVGGLSYFAVLALGPIAEHLMMTGAI